MKKTLLILALMLNGLAHANTNEVTTSKNTSITVQQKNISAVFQDIEIKTLFAIIGKETGKKFYVDANISGKVSLRVKDTSIENVLKMIEQSENLKIEVYGNDFIVKKR